jgi:hypothetical protein
MSTNAPTATTEEAIALEIAYPACARFRAESGAATARGNHALTTAPRTSSGTSARLSSWGGRVALMPEGEAYEAARSSAAVRRPSSGAIGWSAATTLRMCSSSSSPSSSAPA